MAIIDLSAYLYSVLDTLKSFFSYHQAQKCTTSSANKPVDIESAQMQSVQIIAASSFNDAVEQPSCSTIEEEDEEEESEDEEEVEDEEEEELENAEGDVCFAEVNMGRTGKGYHEEKYRDEVIIMSSSFSSGSPSSSSSSESSSDSSEYSDREEDEEGDSSSVSSLELNLSPPSPTARGSLFGRVLTMFGGAKYPNEVDTDYTALIKCGKNGQLNLV